MDAWIAAHCEVIDDAAEDTAVLYALSTSANSLGYTSLSSSQTTSVAGHEYILHQHPDYLRGQDGVTGAVLWSSTPLILNHLLLATPTFSSVQGVLELGSGIGLAACVLGRQRQCTTFIASDYDEVLLRLARRNTDVYAPNVNVMQLDWTDDAHVYIDAIKQELDGIELTYVLCLDCIYSVHLGTALVNTLNSILQQHPNATIVLGQQLREETMHVQVMEMMVESFTVWRYMDDGALAGYVVYFARLASIATVHAD